MQDIPAIYQGQKKLLKDIKVSPFSRAYTFSDSVYEVIPYFFGMPLCLQAHLDRLQDSLDLSGIDADISVVANEIHQLGQELGQQDGYVYFQISRGVDEIRSHMHKEDLVAERFGYVIATKFPTHSISAMLCEDNRWNYCNIKSTSLLGNVLLMNKAKRLGCQEIVMQRDSFMTEAGASSVFYLDSRGIIRTSSLSENILPGITRAILIKALSGSKFEVEEGKCHIKDFKSSPCIWISSSTKGLLPLNKLIGTEYVYQTQNKDFHEINEIFNAAVQSQLLAAK